MYRTWLVALIFVFFISTNSLADQHLISKRLTIPTNSLADQHLISKRLTINNKRYAKLIDGSLVELLPLRLTINKASTKKVDISRLATLQSQLMLRPTPPTSYA